MYKFVCLALMLVGAASPAFAQVYKWTDEDGNVHFSQSPPPDQNSQQLTQHDKQRSGDGECCRATRQLAVDIAEAMDNGLTLGEIYQHFPASEYANVLEVANLVSARRRGGMAPAAIGSLAQSTCLNGRLKACRTSGTQRKGPADRSGSGTGFLVADGLIVTNHHVVKSCKRVSVGEEEGAAKVMATNSTADLALVSASIDLPGQAILTGRSSVTLGEPVVLAGFPLQRILAEEMNVTTGMVSALSGPGNSQRVFQMTAPTQPGNSGGPVLDEMGQVVGVAVAKLDDVAAYRASGSLPQNVNFAIRIAVLKDFLDENSVAYTSNTTGRKRSSTELAAAAGRFTIPITCHGSKKDSSSVTNQSGAFID